MIEIATHTVALAPQIGGPVRALNGQAGWERRAAAIILMVVALVSTATAASAATQVGFKGHSYAGFSAENTGGAITGQKPESKLWYHDRKWWAVMVSPTTAGSKTIWRLDAATWIDTKVVVDTRPWTKEDVLSLGTTLYVTSRAGTGATGNQLRRFTYAGGTYTRDAGFPVSIPGVTQETLTLARDTTGTLWITYEKDQAIYIAHSLGSDTSWTAEFVLPVDQASFVHGDDISSVISFTDATGPAIGIFWSDQTAAADYFAVHRDGAPDTTWTVETALSGTAEADDHINLKTAEGRVYSVVKTNKSDGAATLIWLLIRSTTGVWAKHHVATESESNTRPITVLQIDPTNRQIYVFMTIGEGTGARGISYKVSQMDAVGFPATATTFIQGPNDEVINDATSAKQNTDATTGIVVMASDGSNYWWNKLGGSSSGSPPTATAGSAVTNEDTPVGITLTGSDSDTCELVFSVSTAPAHGSLGSITDQSCTAGSPNTDRATVTYTPAANYSGPDSFSFTTYDGTTVSPPATVSVTVSSVNDVPVAVSSSTSTIQNTSTTVTLNANDPETCSLTFTISSQPAHGSLGPLTNLSCVAGSPNTDQATVVYTPAAGYTGSDSFAFTVSDGLLTSLPGTISITITTAPSGITLRSASSGANATATTLVIPAPSGLSIGDVMLAGITTRGNPAITPPAGWTLVRLNSSNNFTIQQAIYVKVASTEPASYTWTFTSSQGAAGSILAYSGVDTAAPVNVHGGMVSMAQHNKGIINAPSITTTVNGAMIVGFFGISVAATVLPPIGMMERADIAATSGAYLVTHECADLLQTTAGATGVKQAKASGEGPSVGQLLALRPAGA